MWEKKKRKETTGTFFSKITTLSMQCLPVVNHCTNQAWLNVSRSQNQLG
jgi:hypothetical protein